MGWEVLVNMKILEEENRGRRKKIRVENLDDLWFLEKILRPGDVVYAMTYRREEKRNDSIRPEKRERVPVFLGIRVKDFKIHEYSDRLRILGIIELGPALGEHHTLNVGVGSVITLEKEEWSDEELEFLREAIESSEKVKVLIVAMDEEGAQISLLRERGIDHIAWIDSGISGKMFHDRRDEEKIRFFQEVAKKIESIGPEKIIVAGPGFTKEEFLKFLAVRYPELRKKSFSDDVSSSGITGVQEVIRRGTPERFLEESRIVEESKAIDKLLEGISKEEFSSYGLEDVEESLDFGAVDLLLISDDFYRKNREKCEELIRRVRSTGGSFRIVSTSHDAGKILSNLGGVAALLRFKYK